MINACVSASLEGVQASGKEFSAVYMGTLGFAFCLHHAIISTKSKKRPSLSVSCFLPLLASPFWLPSPS